MKPEEVDAWRMRLVSLQQTLDDLYADALNYGQRKQANNLKIVHGRIEELLEDLDRITERPA
jgi:hypothetical protein